MCGAAAQILPLRSLDDSEQHLVRLVGTFRGEPFVFRQTALCPFSGTFQGNYLVVIGMQQGGQLIESENNIGAQVVLNLHRDFRGKPMFGSIQV